jgi:hypothetical protein
VRALAWLAGPGGHPQRGQVGGHTSIHIDQPRGGMALLLLLLQRGRPVVACCPVRPITDCQRRCLSGLLGKQQFPRALGGRADRRLSSVARPVSPPRPPPRPRRAAAGARRGTAGTGRGSASSSGKGSASGGTATGSGNALVVGAAPKPIKAVAFQLGFPRARKEFLSWAKSNGALSSVQVRRTSPNSDANLNPKPHACCNLSQNLSIIESTHMTATISNAKLILNAWLQLLCWTPLIQGVLRSAVLFYF